MTGKSRGNRDQEIRAKLEPGASLGFLLLCSPLAGQGMPRTEGRSSPGQCQVQQLAYFSFRSLSALPKNRGETIRARVSSSRTTSPFYLGVLLHSITTSTALTGRTAAQGHGAAWNLALEFSLTVLE